MSSPGKLYLIPVSITEEGDASLLAPLAKDIAKGLVHFVVENPKTARQQLKLMGYASLNSASMEELNQHTSPEAVESLMKPLLAGNDVGLMSEAGAPGIADPGASLVRLCHEKNIQVVPLPGPSAIMMAIMASGFNAQSFAFNGYLPVDRQQRSKRLRELEGICNRVLQPQFFIETPYRNVQLWETMLSVLAPGTLLFAGINIGSETAILKAMTVARWKSTGAPQMHKVPTVFGIYK